MGDYVLISLMHNNTQEAITMAARFILTVYVNQLMAYAVYGKLDDGTFAGNISECNGVLAFGTTLRECEDELHSTLEDGFWLASNWDILCQ